MFSRFNRQKSLGRSHKIKINYLLFLDCSKIIKRSEIDCTITVFFNQNRSIALFKTFDVNIINESTQGTFLECYLAKIGVDDGALNTIAP